MHQYKVKPLSNIAKIGLDKLEGTDCSLEESIDNPDGVLVRSTKITPEDLNSELKAISRAGAGVNNIPVDICTDQGIVVFNTPGANANAVKELVLAGLMLSSRNVYASIDFVNELTDMDQMSDLEPFLESNKKQFKGSELAGSTLGVWLSAFVTFWFLSVLGGSWHSQRFGASSLLGCSSGTLVSPGGLLGYSFGALGCSLGGPRRLRWTSGVHLETFWGTLGASR